jgi:hypothetical protein
MTTGLAGPRPFFQTWVNALTKPNERTYQDIASAPNAKATTAFLWIFIASLVQFFISFLVGNAAQSQLLRQFGGGQNLPTPSFGNRAITLICGAPIAAVVAVLFFAIFVGIMHLIARAFGGRATFDQSAYVIAAIAVPFYLISAVLSLLGAIPFVGFCFGILDLVLGIYVLILQVMAVKGVHQISWGGAVVAVLVLPIVLVVCVACAVIAGLMVLGPVIGNVFSSINQSLQGVP